MAQKTESVIWRMKGKWLKNCSCDPGCPCDFWAKPTHTTCEGMLGMEVEDGNFGRVSLKGVKFAATYHWPGPLWEGNGSVQPFLDEKTTQAQRDAILQILSGKAGNTWFEVLASIIKTIHEPKVVPIQFEHDIKKVKAKLVIPGILETTTEPIKNIISGEAYRISVNIPGGMEFKTEEVATAIVNKSMGEIKYDWPKSHSCIALVEHTQDGLKK